MKRITSLFVALTLILCISLIPLFTASATSPTKWYETYGDYDYTLLADETVRIERYNGTDATVRVPSTLAGYKVTSLGEFAFYNCETLVSITIPDSITNIDDSALNNCAELSEIKIDSNNKFYDSRENCNAIIESKTNTLISGCMNTTIPNSVVTINDGAFVGCINLTSITIPEGTTSIGGAAFIWCENLKSITVSDTVTNIEKDVFAHCINLSEIKVDSNNKVYDSRNNCNGIIKTETNELLFGCMNTIIPDDVTSIADGAFSYCENLTSITIPSSVTSIGKSAFSCCYNLTSISIPDRVTHIGDYAFFACEALTSVTIPQNVKNIGYSIFSRCNSLSEIIVDNNNEVYDSRNDCNAIIDTKSNTLICGCINTTIPNSVVAIDDGAFISCQKLTSITIPESIVIIGDDAFNGCDALTSITIPKSVKDIGENAFGASYEDKVYLYVYKGSYAHKYAESENLDFELIVTDSETTEILCVSVVIIILLAIIILCIMILAKKKKATINI